MSKSLPVRPGLIIKEALQGSPIGISEMHRICKARVNEVNVVRSRSDRIRSATYRSLARQ